MLPDERRDLSAERARIMRATKQAKRYPDDPDAQAEVVAIRAAYFTEKLAAFIKKTVAEAPPLTAEQRDRLAALLRSA